MLTFRRRSRVVTTWAVIAVLVASCGESKVSQCNRLAEVVNKAQGFMPEFENDIQTFSTNAAQVRSLEDIKAAADQYVDAVNNVVGNLEALSVELNEVQLSDEGLVAYRDRYIDMVEGFSSALKQASDAMSIVQDVEAEADLPAKIEESQQQTVQAVQLIQDLSVQESTIISEVNTYCGANSEEAAPETPATEGE
ncbi:MAG: hypothetical protein F6K42_07175 [Leptolyngbya sp. SIO1D8]|nr:hypothetical protein [Leptolyngbya sp. SIO1D8]